MHEVSVVRTFSAAHNLRGYQGKCEALHGHNWKIETTVTSEILDALGMVIDFKDLKQSIDQVLDQFDHKYLNELFPFDTINPSCENIARVICEQMIAALNDGNVRVTRVRLWESEGSFATFTPGSEEFSAE